MTQESQRWKDQLDYAAITDIGMRRSNNQDHLAVQLAADIETWRRRGHLFLVADGMGAHAAGELASQLAADSIPHLYFKHRDLSGPESLKRAIVETNAEINRKGQANQEFHNMGTTCSVLTLIPQGAVVAHVGDSRVYRLRRGNLEQLTFDHSLVWEMRASGQSRPDSDLDNMIPRNVITRSLGPYPDVKVDVEGPFPLEIGDVFLLCSDGLVGEVSDEELGPILENLPPSEAAQALVDLANLRGGPDNITVLVCQIKGNEVIGPTHQEEPLTVNQRRKRSPVNTILWAGVAACVLASGLMALLAIWPAVFVLGGMALITFLVASIRQFGGEAGGTVISGTKRFGRGPYTKTPSVADRALLDKLAKMIDELRSANEESSLNLDLQAVEAELATGEQALELGKPGIALQSYVRALSDIMAQLRKRR